MYNGKRSFLNCLVNKTIFSCGFRDACLFFIKQQQNYNLSPLVCNIKNNCRIVV